MRRNEVRSSGCSRDDEKRGGAREHPAPAEVGLGGRVRLRHRVHGHRPGRPDPAGDQRPARRDEAQTELLFTSYLLVTGLAMFFTSFVSSRIGAKPTLLIGLALIVIFAALAGASGTRRTR